MIMAFWSGVAAGGKETLKLLLEVQQDLQEIQNNDVHCSRSHYALTVLFREGCLKYSVHLQTVMIQFWQGWLF